MPIVRTLLLFALFSAARAMAETLATPSADPAAAVDRPARGSTMASVTRHFGEPTNRHATVGKPPITRWDYPQFSVYFENDRVLHSVIVRSASTG